MSTVGTFLRPRVTIGRDVFCVLAALAEGITIVVVSVLVGIGHHLLAYGDYGEVAHFAAVGCVAAWIFALPSIFRDEYRMQVILEGRRSAKRLFYFWNYMFLSLALLGFVTKTSAMFSRGWIILFYVAGLLGVLAVNALIRWTLTQLIESGRIERRRVMLVSIDQDVRSAARELTSGDSGAEVAAVVKLDTHAGKDGRDFTPGDLENALSWARSLNIDDVVVLADWSYGKSIDQIVSAFTVLPAAIHVGAAGVIRNFSSAKMARFGSAPVLSVRNQPLQPGQAVIKRAFDIVASSLAILLLMPLFAVVALSIRYDSNGPVLFLQRRRGYNQKVFQIWKFRTMTVMDDGEHVIQAHRNDARVTSVGRFLRRYNIDELPQLINVLRGEMSLVGPRPHAVAHDRMYEKVILQYPRRLNVRPGITGWAQVNGLRGKTDTERDMAQRLEFDLHYIDNWSLGLDFYILALTVLSPRAYRNAH